MNLTPSSFVGGRALRAVVRVLQEGETTTNEYLCCLDSGSDVNLAKRHLLHSVRSIETEAISNCGDETRFIERGFFNCLFLALSKVCRHSSLVRRNYRSVAMCYSALAWTT